LKGLRFALLFVCNRLPFGRRGLFIHHLTMPLLGFADWQVIT
jgi:hypothetical protein